jgi:hypothetical protein
MGVYNDLANDAGYSYGTPENEQMAQMIEEEDRRQYQRYLEEKELERQVLEEEQDDPR